MSFAAGMLLKPNDIEIPFVGAIITTGISGKYPHFSPEPTGSFIRYYNVNESAVYDQTVWDGTHVNNGTINFWGTTNTDPRGMTTPGEPYGHNLGLYIGVVNGSGPSMYLGFYSDGYNVAKGHIGTDPNTLTMCFDRSWMFYTSVIDGSRKIVKKNYNAGWPGEYHVEMFPGKFAHGMSENVVVYVGNDGNVYKYNGTTHTLFTSGDFVSCRYSYDASKIFMQSSDGKVYVKNSADSNTSNKGTVLVFGNCTHGFDVNTQMNRLTFAHTDGSIRIIVI